VRGAVGCGLSVVGSRLSATAECRKRPIPRYSLALILLATLACSDARVASGQGRGDDARAAAAAHAGRYDEAIAILTPLAERADATPGARRLLLRTLAEVGRYEDAERAGRRFAGGSTGGELSNVLGEVLYRRGKVAAAESAYVRAGTARASDTLVARLNLGVLRWERGEKDAAMRLFEQVVAAAEDGGRLTADDLAAAGTAYRYLGRDDPQLFRNALRAFDAAAAAAPDDPEPRARAGELFLLKYNSPEAAKSFDEALKLNPRHPRALVGAARRRQFDDEPGAADLARQALKTNPNFVDAHVFLAAQHLDAEDYERAAAEVERALAVDPTSLDALSTLAAVRHLQGDRAGAEEAARRVLARDPTHAELYATMAELSARHRLYQDAVGLAERAVRLDARAWRAHALLGINQMRVGKFAEARKSLETAFAGDPYDVWVKNTLDLLDATAGYEETRSRRFHFVADSQDAELLTPYLSDLMEEAYDRLAARYGYRPPTPVRLELYRSHADFSVRTVGLAGLGALGVSFGSVLAMDSPAAREAGQFNWGSTAWHELAHAFTLGMTDHKVPRWLSEGISVLEERRARPGWGDDVSPVFLAAYEEGRLHPVSRLNDGFMRPSYPQQVAFSYYQASLVCEMIERQWGERALPEMLRGYKDGLSTEQVVARVLKTDMPELDRRFDAYLRERFAAPLATVRAGRPNGGAPGGTPTTGAADAGDFAAQLAAGRARVEAGKPDEAVPYLQRAKALFPRYGGADSPHWYLATIYKDRGKLREAASELAELVAVSETHYKAHLELADLRERLGDRAGAAAALDAALYIYPYDAAVHARLAALYAGLGERAKVVRERRAVVALAPVDAAEAHYQLALAYYEAGDAAAARRELLRALEMAPGFERAQELLLKLRESPSRTGTASPPGAGRGSES
jgi:cellulose synthase operon protein C